MLADCHIRRARLCYIKWSRTQIFFPCAGTSSYRLTLGHRSRSGQFESWQCISFSPSSCQSSNFSTMLSLIKFNSQDHKLKHSQVPYSAPVVEGTPPPYRPESLQTVPPPSPQPSLSAACPDRPYGCCCPHSPLRPPIPHRASCSCVVHRVSAHCSSVLVRGVPGPCARRQR